MFQIVRCMSAIKYHEVSFFLVSVTQKLVSVLAMKVSLADRPTTLLVNWSMQ